MRVWSYLFVLFVALVACDSTSSVQDPAETHFVRFYGQDGDQTGRDLVVLPDGNLVLFGTTKPTTPKLGVQWYVAKVDPNGRVIWEREFGGPNDEEARDIELTSANNLVLVGNSYKTATDRDILIITVGQDGAKIDSSLIAVRDVLTGLPSSGDEDVSTVTETSDGFIIAGSTTYVNTPSPGNLHDPLQVRVYTNLQVYPNSWVQSKGNAVGSDDYSYKIVPEPGGSGEFYEFGTSNNPPPGQTIANYNYWLTVLQADGNPKTVQNYFGSASGDERMSGFSPAPLGYVLSGVTKNATGNCDLYVAVVGYIDVVVGFNPFLDQPLSLGLGQNITGNTSVIYSSAGAYYVLGEENSFNNNQNWVLTKLRSSDGAPVWNLPLIFGGLGLDECGAIKELSDGKLMIIGTMRTGRPDAGEFKMTLVKVNRDGKFQ